MKLVTDREVDHKPLLDAFHEADESLRLEFDNFIRRNGLIEVVKVRGDLDTAIASYRSFNDDLARELIKLNSTREARQRAAYLDQFSIRHANISGIGPAKMASLISFGIETAADVNQSMVLRVPGFGDVMTGRLMDWRRRHESRFRYNHMPNAQDVVEEKALRAKFAGQKAKLEAIIRNGLTTLLTAKPRLERLPGNARSNLALTKAIEKRANAEQDIKTLGIAVPNSTVVPTISPPPQRPVQSPQVVRPAPTPQLPTTGAKNVLNCPRCGSPMRLRSGRYGRFWGCSRYPNCRGTRNF